MSTILTLRLEDATYEGDMDIPVRADKGIIVGYILSADYPFSSVVVQHNFIERGYSDEV